MKTLVTNPRRFAIVAISRDEAIIWKEGLDSTFAPLRLKPPIELDHRHRRTGEGTHRRETPHHIPEYFEEIAKNIAHAESILIMSHGTGKASYGSLLVEYLNEKHPEQSIKIVDLIRINLAALSVHEIEAHARGWFETHHSKLGSWHSRKADRRFT